MVWTCLFFCEIDILGLEDFTTRTARETFEEDEKLLFFNLSVRQKSLIHRRLGFSPQWNFQTWHEACKKNISYSVCFERRASKTFLFIFSFCSEANLRRAAGAKHPKTRSCAEITSDRFPRRGKQSEWLEGVKQIKDAKRKNEPKKKNSR